MEINIKEIGEKMKKVITSESVNVGHPDKTCDIIADAFLDEALKQDKDSQMAVECAIKNDKLFIYGEATTKAEIDYEKIAREVLKDIGYQNEFTIVKELSCQSPDINQAVIRKELCANDQGMVYGYACTETKELMPLPIMVAHKLMKKYDEFRRGTDDFFADAKGQVSVEYDGKQPIRFSTIIISVSHSDSLSQDKLQTIIKENVLNPVLEEYKNFLDENTRFLINPSGKFTIWGSFSDSGCVGRKIVVDTYGGVGRVGGGCFSSKNATKVDRTGAYFARYVAKNVVGNKLADECEIQIGFSIGLPKPISINIDCFGSNHLPMEKIEEFVYKNFDFRLEKMIEKLELNSPIFKATAAFGHFGREEFPWERVEKLS